MDAFGFMQLTLIALMVISLCMILTLARISTDRTKQQKIRWQVLVGVLFGAVSSIATVLETSHNGITVNLLDTAPLAAGLFFGGPAGIIAGTIGAAVRWFSVAWGTSGFTQVASCISCLLTGIYAALLRKHLFDGRSPSWPMAIATAVVTEVLHLLLIFTTNPYHAQESLVYAQHGTGPLILFASITMAASSLAIARLSGQRSLGRRNERGVAQIVQGRLLIGVIAAFLVTVGFTALVQTNLANAQARLLLSLNISDVEQEITDASDTNLLNLTKSAAGVLYSTAVSTNEECTRLAQELDVAEVSVIDRNGIIMATNVPEFVGFNMNTGAQSREFLDLLPTGTKRQFVQSYQPIAYDSSRSRKYAGITIEDGFVQVGYDADNFLEDLAEHVEAAVKNRRVGETGSLIVIDERGTVVSTRNDATVRNANQLVVDAGGTEPGNMFSTMYESAEYFACYEEVEGYRIIALLPKTEAFFARNLSILIMSYMEVLVFAALFLVIYFAIKRVVVRSIWQVNGRLGQITQGDLDVEVDVRSSTEFASLSDDINQTVGALKNSIALVQADLEMAADIQANSLPTITPAIAAYPQFELLGSMEPAKEVGGDFYDFFLIDDDHLALVVADVSGKGVPAALFMMKSKTVIKMEALSGLDPASVLLRANADLSEKNDDDMFTTAWIGVLEISTGTLVYADAGHEKLALFRNGSWELPPKPNGAVALAAFEQDQYGRLSEKYRFRNHTIVLQPGDALLQYTDGVTEATNGEEKLFGEERLLDALKNAPDASPEKVLPYVREQVAEFVQEAPQFDDLTMLGLLYKG